MWLLGRSAAFSRRLPGLSSVTRFAHGRSLGKVDGETSRRGCGVNRAAEADRIVV